MKLSVVIPVYNERNSLEELVNRLIKVLGAIKNLEYEIWFIDDGSSDGSFEIIKKISQKHKVIKAIKFRINMGKTIALREGFSQTNGELVLTMDADLQDFPEEIPNLINKIGEGYDLVTGWKQQRFDPWHKVIPSKIFNWMISKISKIKIHDMNCGLKIMRREVVDEINLYGELHRFIPWLAYQRGFRIGEIVVKHEARKHGVSKYGWGRMIAGFFDLLTQAFLLRFGRRPAHFFGTLGVIMGSLGMMFGLYLTIIWFNGQKIGGRPLLILVVLLILIGIQMMSFGFLSELMLGLKKVKDLPPVAEVLD